jgi:hypothetical protein
MTARGATARQIEVAACVRRHGGNQSNAAAELGVARATVTRILQTYERHATPLPRARARLAPESFAANLSRAASSLTPDDVAEGRLWWVRARDEVAWLAEFYGLPFERVAYAAAALSPGLRWEATLDTLRMLLDAHAAGAPMPRSVGHLTFGHRDREKAWGILAGGASTLCRGPKVEAVAANLLGDLNAVAVDRHIVRAATGSDRRQVSPATTAKIAGALRLLAAIRGMRPAELQAALWVAGSRL